MKKTTLQEVKDKFFISMTSKEKFDYDSQRIQKNCRNMDNVLEADSLREFITSKPGYREFGWFWSITELL